MKFKSDIEVQAGLKDSSGALGLSGQILSSTSGNVSWVTPTVNTVARDVQNQVKAGVAINKGQAVYVTGADGTNIIVGLASNTSEATSSKTLGLLNATVAANGFADVVQIGKLSGLNTIGATAGDPVWLGTNGNLIYGLINKPYAPAHLVFIGIVTRVNSNNGEIFVSVQNGFELNEIHDVDLKTTVPISGDILGFNGTLWVNKTIAGWLGYTPANANGTLNYVSKFTGATTLGNSQIFDNGTRVGIGTTSPSSILHIQTASGTASKLYIGQAATAAWSIGNNASANTFSIIDEQFSAARLFIGSTGNVGIGTSSPNVELSLYNSSTPRFHLQNSTSGLGSTSGFQLALSSVDAYLWNFQNGASVFGTNNTERMRITPTGNVGIGTSSPSGLLHLYKNNSPVVLRLQSASPYAYPGDFSIQTGGYGSNDFIIYDNISSVERLYINAAGNVGIGTTSPSSKLQLSGTDQSGLLSLLALENFISTNPANGNGVAIDFRLNNSGNPSYVCGKIGLVNTFYRSNTDMTFSVANSDTLSERMRITNTGNVGIGTTSPAEKLVVGGASGATSTPTAIRLDDTYRTGGDAFDKLKLFLYKSSSETYGFGLGDVGDLQYWAGTTSTGAHRFFTSQTERMRITSTGNVGIGTSSPSEKLHISGNTLVTGTLEVDTVNNGVGDFLTRTAGGIVTRRTAAEVRSDIGAQAALTNPVTGTGTLNFVSKFTSTGSTLGNSQIFDDGSSVGIGTSGPLNKVDIVSSNNDNFGAITVRPSNQTQTLSLGWQGVATSLNFIVSTGGTERMRVTNTGNVNIGTASGGTRLYVDYTTNGSDGIVSRNLSAGTSAFGYVGAFNNLTNGIDLRSYSSTHASLPSTSVIQSSSGQTGGTIIIQSGANPIRFNTNASERMRISGTGEVGIGTTAPSFPLSFGTSLGNKIALYDASSGNGYGFGVQASLLQMFSNAVGDDITFGYGNSASMVRNVTFKGTGNVGIGTTAPVDKLDVNGSIRFRLNTPSFTGAIDSGVLDFVPTSIFPTDPQIRLAAIGTATVGASIAFQTGLSTTVAERMRITSAGNVGIGISNPVAKLDVFSSGTVQTAVLGRGLDGNFRLVTAQDVSTNADQSVIGLIGLDYITTPNAAVRFHRGGSTTGGFITFTTNNGNEKMRITSGGNVGIGTSSPSYPLYVAAQVSNISIYANYDIVAYSDQSVKENIRPIENALERVIKSRGVLYDRIDSGEKDNIGFIAQELEVEFPELVVTNENGTKAVKYQNTVAVLFEAIKEQQKQIEELKQLLNGITN